jgi:hypothetical protein
MSVGSLPRWSKVERVVLNALAKQSRLCRQGFAPSATHLLSSSCGQADPPVKHWLPIVVVVRELLVSIVKTNRVQNAQISRSGLHFGGGAGFDHC